MCSSYSAWNVSELLCLAEVDLAVERAKLEVGSAAGHGAVNGAVHFEAILRLVLRVVAAAIPVVILSRIARRCGAGRRLGHLHVEIGIHVTTVAPHLQGRLRGWRQRHVDVTVERSEGHR